LEVTGSRSAQFTQFDFLLHSTEQVPVVFVFRGKEVHSSPAPTSISDEKDGQEWEYNIEDMVGGDHDGQSGGDPPPACPCHNTPIGSCPGFFQTFVSLVSAVTHHPSGGANMDGARNNKIHSDPATPSPTSISHEKDGQEGEYDIKDMVGGDHDGQSGGDPPSACTCHSTPIGCGPGFTQTCVSLATAVTHHPGDGTNMDDTGMELPDKTVQPKPWEEWLCGYYNKEVLVNSL
jgi:hypothetical protein